MSMLNTLYYLHTTYYYNTVLLLTSVEPNSSSDLVHSSTLGLIGPTCRELAIVAILILLSSSNCCISSVPPRINTSLLSLCGNTVNSVGFHESSTYT